LYQLSVFQHNLVPSNLEDQGGREKRKSILGGLPSGCGFCSLKVFPTLVEDLLKGWPNKHLILGKGRMWRGLYPTPLETASLRKMELKLFFFFFMVLGLELRAYTLSHSTNPF
jgi:hypothetical protein